MSMDGVIELEAAPGALTEWHSQQPAEPRVVACVRNGVVTAYRSSARTTRLEQFEIIGDKSGMTVTVRTNGGVAMELTLAQWEHIDDTVRGLLRQPEPHFPPGCDEPAEDAVMCVRTGKTWKRTGRASFDRALWTDGQNESTWYSLNQVDPMSEGFRRTDS